MFSYHVTKKPRHGSVSHKTKEHLTKRTFRAVSKSTKNLKMSSFTDSFH